MEYFDELEPIKALFFGAKYINLSTIRGDGTPHPSNVRVAHGHSLSLYFLSETNSEKAKNIIADGRISGSVLIDVPKPGEGVNFYFNGVAHQISKGATSPSLLPEEYGEREKMIRVLCEGRNDYLKNIDDILTEKTNIRLHRIILTDAWYNGGVFEKGNSHESNATRKVKIVSDKACPFVRRYFVDADKPIPDYGIVLSSDMIAHALGVKSHMKLAA